MGLRRDERMARRAGVASLFGTAIEWFDFYIFGTAAALVFGQLFFPQVSPAIGILASFATFWVGFLARPLGGVVFGHVGDRIGRKGTLIITLLLMGGATAAIGLLPTFETAGPAAPVALVVLRALQGLAVGGEWGGAVLIATEHAGRRRSVLFGAFAQQGSPIGHILAALSFAVMTQLPEPAFLAWGWRVPFLASAVLVFVGLVVRMKIEESPALVHLRNTRQLARYPLVDVIKEQKATVVVAILTITAVMTSAYFKSTFVLSWATTDLAYQRRTILTIIMIGAIVQFFVQPFGAVLATRFDAKKMVTTFLSVEVLLLPVMFVLIHTGSPALAVVGIALATVPNVMFYATTAGLLADAFPARYRYTGMSVSYAFASTLFGGSTPVIGQALLTATDSIAPVAAYGVVMVLVSLLAVRALISRTRRQEDGDELDEPASTLPGQTTPSHPS